MSPLAIVPDSAPAKSSPRALLVPACCLPAQPPHPPGLTVLEGALFGAGYEAIGVRSDSADSSPRLLRSGLSERMRGLVDDHERRLKGILFDMPCLPHSDPGDVVERLTTVGVG